MVTRLFSTFIIRTSESVKIFSLIQLGTLARLKHIAMRSAIVHDWNTYLDYLLSYWMYRSGTVIEGFPAE